ncbi:MAG: 2,3-bisphosphoglycerate-independent phosphoglycerate mutase [Oscillospiraceae bacterium]|nr:2,3-bisphosphoglycerate-independent phosphoglycerate mutase [Oscillospiraceae bacterium]
MTKPVVLVVMDGVGIGDGGPGDAVKKAHTPNLDHLLATCPNTTLKAHGTAVGLPTDDDMGNSEVGHNTLGCGQIYAQGAKLVGESIQSGSIFQSRAWNTLLDGVRRADGRLHFLGLLSDGNVHSHMDHLIALLRQAKVEGIHTAFCHILLDGRDVPATSALQYVERLENVLSDLNDDTFTGKIASGGGRMNITMDRYEADWDMVKRGFDCHVHGIGRQFADAKTAIETYRQETGCIDQDLGAFVIAENGAPVGRIRPGDSVILFNFRGDRALEISRALGDPDFDRFDRGDYHDVLFAGMLEYDGDAHIPERYLVEPPVIENTLTELLVANGINEFALSETQKYGHVTYFWNGNRSGKVSEELETYVEIPSDNCPFDQKPAMKCREITDCLIEAMESHRYGFLRCNFPNGDMVGHTGVFDAVVTSMEALDVQLGRIMQAAEREGYVLAVTADHGNADVMLEKNKKGEYQVRTAHSLSAVPFVLQGYEGKLGEGPYGLSNVAATIAELLGLEKPASWDPSMLA